MMEYENVAQIITKILASSTIDEKRKLGKEAIALFKNTNQDIPVAIRLNLSLQLRDTIDNFIIQDNLTSRETLENFFPLLSKSLKKAC